MNKNKAKATGLYGLALAIVGLASTLDVLSDRMEKAADAIRERAAEFDDAQVTNLTRRLMRAFDLS